MHSPAPTFTYRPRQAAARLWYNARYNEPLSTAIQVATISSHPQPYSRYNERVQSNTASIRRSTLRTTPCPHHHDEQSNTLTNHGRQQRPAPSPTHLNKLAAPSATRNSMPTSNPQEQWVPHHLHSIAGARTWPARSTCHTRPSSTSHTPPAAPAVT